MQHLSDIELVNIYRSDKEGKRGQDAVAEMYRRFWVPILKQMKQRAFGCDLPTVEDVVQEAFINFIRHADTYDPTIGTVHGYILYIANRKLTDELRQAAKRLPTFSAIVADPDHLFTQEITDARQIDPQDIAIHDEIIQRFWDFANKLDSLGRDIMVMTCAHNYPRNTVARQLGVNRNTVARQLRALLPRLQAYLGPYRGEIKSICFERREFTREVKGTSENIAAA